MPSLSSGESVMSTKQIFGSLQILVQPCWLPSSNHRLMQFDSAVMVKWNGKKINGKKTSSANTVKHSGGGKISQIPGITAISVCLTLQSQRTAFTQKVGAILINIMFSTNTAILHWLLCSHIGGSIILSESFSSVGKGLLVRFDGAKYRVTNSKENLLEAAKDFSRGSLFSRKRTLNTTRTMEPLRQLDGLVKVQIRICGKTSSDILLSLS